jgi:hypothetical protein
LGENPQMLPEPFNLSYRGIESGPKGLHRRVIRFIELFNQESAIPIQGDLLEQHAAVARRAVLAEICRPETAQFDWVFARQCSDGMIRAAGSVHLTGINGDGSDGERAQRWYMVEFFTPTMVEMLDLIDRDPVTLKSIPSEEWGEDVLRYKRRGVFMGSGNVSLARWLIWPAVILLAAAGIMMILS